MADWRELVRERLSGLALDAGEKDEVQAEVAAHLEESYESLREKGLTDHAAMQQVLAQVSDWKSLQRDVYFAKRGVFLMQKRLQQLWIPGFLTLILSTFSLMTAQTCGFQPPIFWSAHSAVLLYVPWLASLPFLGALGAYLSSRAGGSRRTVLLATVFPALALTTAFLLMFPIGWIVEELTANHNDFSVVASALLKDGVGWLLLPAAALLAGGLLAQSLFGRRSSPQDRVTG